jgi:hypothetical protein
MLQNCFGLSSPEINRVSERSREPSPPARITAVLLSDPFRCIDPSI